MSALNDMNEIWSNSLEMEKARGAYRTLFQIKNMSDNESKHSALQFSSNDYLGLKNDSRLAEAGFLSASKSGSGSGSSRSVLQSDHLIEELENYFCRESGFKYTLFLPSGFVANLVFLDVLQTYGEEVTDQEIFIDHRCHASLFFSIKSTNLKHTIFKHNSLDHLEMKLKSSLSKFKIIVIESLFSMDGDFFPLENLHLLCHRYDALIYIDESHSFGLYGPNGAGYIHQFPKLNPYLLAGSFGCGKAVGVSGGFLATNSYAFRERIIQKSKLFIYSTGISPFITGAVYASLKIIFSIEGDERRKKLFHNINYLIELMKNYKSKFPILFERDGISPIIPFIFKNNEKCLSISNLCIENNIILKCIRPPSVPNNTSRLRMCVSSSHSIKDFDNFYSYFRSILHD